MSIEVKTDEKIAKDPKAKGPKPKLGEWTWDSLDYEKAPRFTVFGRTGSGKTVFAKELIQQYRRRGWRCIVIDTKLEFDSIPAFTPEVFKKKGGWVRRVAEITVGGNTVDNTHCLAEFFAEFCWHFPKIFIYCEEVGAVIAKMSQLYSSSPWLAKILLQGRSVNRGIVIVSQEPSITHSDFIKQADDIFVFSCNPAEEASLPKWVGYRVDFKSMEKWGFWSMGTNCLYPPVQISKKEEWG